MTKDDKEAIRLIVREELNHAILRGSSAILEARRICKQKKDVT